MSLSSSSGSFRLGRSVVVLLSAPHSLIALCYCAGLVATTSLGQGAAGQPLMNLAAPAVAGLLIRSGRRFGRLDLAMLAAIRLAFAALVGESAVSAAAAFALDAAAISAGVLIFARLRRAGFVSSQVRIAAALVAVSVAASAILSMKGFASAAFVTGEAAAAAAEFVSTALGALLVMMLALTFDRAERRLAGPADIGGEGRPGASEFVVAWVALAAVLAAVVFDGRQEIALGASVVLAWFATRLGLFATSLAAFLLVATLDAFLVGDAWAALAGAKSLAQAELLRGLALALLSAPSLFVAAVIHDHRAARRDYAFRALHDGLTTLANRARFLDVLTGATTTARAKGRRFALFLIDLDHFKAVNDRFGHAAGDGLLIEVSRLLQDSVRATDLVARLGGDEFAVIAPVPTPDDATRLAGRLVAAINRNCLIDGLELRPSVTIGVVVAPDSSVEPARLMALADHALYEAKAAGRNCWRICSAEAADAFAVDWLLDDQEMTPQIVYLD